MPESEELDMNILYRVISLRKLQGNFTKAHTETLLNTYKRVLKFKEPFKDITRNYVKRTKVNIEDEDLETLSMILISIAFKSSFTSHNIDNFMNRYNYFYRTFKLKSKDHVKFIDNHLTALGEMFNIDFSNFLPEIIFHSYTHSTILRKFITVKFAVYSDLVNTTQIL